MGQTIDIFQSIHIRYQALLIPDPCIGPRSGHKNLLFFDYYRREWISVSSDKSDLLCAPEKKLKAAPSGFLVKIRHALAFQ
jgi:hypothetical protein